MSSITKRKNTRSPMCPRDHALAQRRDTSEALQVSPIRRRWGQLTKRKKSYASPLAFCYRSARRIRKIVRQGGSQKTNRKVRQARSDAGTQRYNVGTDTPRLWATSRGGTPLASSFLADSILLSVICRLRPPLRSFSAWCICLRSHPSARSGAGRGRL